MTGAVLVARCAAGSLSMRVLSLVLALGLSPVLALLLSHPARAEDLDTALASLRRTPPAAARSAPVDAAEWSRRLRAPDEWGPMHLSPVDTALLAAARAGRWAEAAQLLKDGAAANARDEAGGHALVYAAAAGRDDLVRELIRRGAELDRVSDDGATALGAAAFRGRRSTVRLLVLAGADVERPGAGGQTALHLAALTGQVEVVDELLRLHVDPELLNTRRESALDVAAVAGRQQAMERLLAAGADSARAGGR